MKAILPCLLETLKELAQVIGLSHFGPSSRKSVGPSDGQPEGAESGEKGSHTSMEGYKHVDESSATSLQTSIEKYTHVEE